MAVFIIDGQRVEFSKAADLVAYMHANAFAQAADDVAYMLDVSDRTVLQSGEKIRTTSPEAFVNDLVRHHLLEVADWNDKAAPPVEPTLKDVEVVPGYDYLHIHHSNEYLLGFVEAVLYEARKRAGV